MNENRPKMLWIKSRMPGAVTDGSSLVSLNLAMSLAHDFEFDLVSQKLKGNEEEIASKPDYPFANVFLVDPPNRGGVVKRILYRVYYSLNSYIRRVPRGALYEIHSNMCKKVNELIERKDYDLVHIEYWTAAYLIDFVKFKCPVILLLHDATYLTEMQKYKDRGSVVRWLKSYSIKRLKRFEIEYANKADYAHFISELDRREFRENGVRNTEHIPVLLKIPRQFVETAPSFRALFLGNMGHFPNLDAVRWLARDIFQLVVKDIPEARLIVAGGGITQNLRDELAYDYVDIAGWVEDLGLLYAGATVVVAPIRFGTGINIKVLEAIGFGRPLVGTSLALKGTPGEQGGALVANNAASFAESIKKLMLNQQLREKISETALDLLEKDHSGMRIRNEIRFKYLTYIRE